MRKFKVCRCPECHMTFRTIGGWSSHIDKRHTDLIPPGFTHLQYFYFLQTGKSKGTCINCGNETSWNEEMGKYNRYCANPKCKEEYREIFKKRMIGKHGKVHMLNDPNMQKKMLSNRKISGKYKFETDNSEIGYVGSYEKDFLAMLDRFMHYQGEEIMQPSPHTYYYMYEGKKHFYIPDFYIAPLNLEVEIKTHDNTHHKFLEVDRVKEELKDEVLRSIENVNYIKIIDKDYTSLFQYLLELKESIPNEDLDEGKISVMESTYELTSEDSISDIYDHIIANENSLSLEEGNSRSEVVMEATVDDAIGNIKNIAITKSRWRDILFTPAMVKHPISMFVKVVFDTKTRHFIIRGLNGKRLITRMRRFYENSKLENIFINNYNARDYEKYEKKLIGKSQMKITSIEIPEFFVLEFLVMMREVYGRYRDIAYLTAMKKIYMQSWLSKSDSGVPADIDLTPLKNMRPTLFDYQKDFIKNFNKLKHALNLNGYILGFIQGLGKTLTAIGLTECLEKKKIFIVCPNNLKDNWAGEIRQYFEKYDDDKTFYNEIMIVDDNRYYETPFTKYFIINNESILKFLPYIHNSAREDMMLIVDESHNFRNYKGKRTEELVEAHERMRQCDCLLCSGTPLKALPSEIIPSLMLIDPTFNKEAALMYNRAFNNPLMITSRILQTRLGNVIYRRTKGPDLPKMYEDKMLVTMPNSEKYLLKNVGNIVGERFQYYWGMEYKNNEKYKDRFIRLLDKYCSASTEDRQRYNDLIVDVVNDAGIPQMHELDFLFCQNFMNNFVYPNIDNLTTLKEAKQTYKDYVMMRQHCIGKAIGEILPKYRTEMFINVYREMSDKLIEMIQNCDKKTIIFSMMLGVVNYIYEDLTKRGVGIVKVVGGHPNENRAAIKRFKEDDTVDVVIATSQTMSTGLTLIEASQMFFFGPPWRSTDYDQCCCRMYRIGQTSDVYVWNVLLDTEKPNLSTRINSILEWSNNLFHTQIDSEDVLNTTKIYESVQSEYFNTSCNFFTTKEPYPYIDAEIALESTVYDRAKLTADDFVPVYIILEKGNSPFSKIIMASTGDGYSHAAIAFKSNFNTLFTFGPKKVKGEIELEDFNIVNMGKGHLGFTIESFYNKIFKNIPYAAYVVFVTKEEQEKMKYRLHWFVKNAPHLKYNGFGLMKIFFRIPSENETKFFCSGFVADILNSGGIQHTKYGTTLNRPHQLAFAKDAYLVNSGLMGHCSKEVTEKNTQKWLKVFLKTL